MPRLSKEAWIVVRAEYESGAIRSLRGLADKYGCNEKAIRLQAAKEDQEGGPWQRPPSLPIQIADAVGKAVRKVRETREPSTGKGEAIAAKLRKRQADIAELAKEPDVIIEEFTNPPNSAEADPPPKPSEQETPQAESSSPHSAEFSPPPAEPEPPPAQPNPEPAPEELPPIEHHPLFEAAALDVSLSMQARILKDAMTSMVAVNLAHLDERVEPLKKLFIRQMELLTSALATPADDDVDGQTERDKARKALLAGGRDSISGQVAALVRLSESIQQQERKALGLEGPGLPRGRKPGYGADEGGQAGDAATAADALPDLSGMDTEQLETLYQAAVVLEGQRERPPILLPPGRRVVIEAEQEGEPPNKD